MRDLIIGIQECISSPQKSERWAMYRLIAPVVDLANSTLGFEAYFEFNQTSAHGTSQSVDIALLDSGVPMVMVEAKRVDRRISAEQISKYLIGGVRGVVSNGVHWVLCLDGASKAISLLDADGLLSIDGLREVVGFIRGEEPSKVGWSREQIYVDPVVKPEKLRKENNASRMLNSVSITAGTSEMRRMVNGFSGTSNLDGVLMNSLLDEFEAQGGIPKQLRCEVRESRVVFFDGRKNDKRVSRIKLGMEQPDVLVLTDLVGSESRLSKICTPSPHDGGPHMRRFRISEALQAEEFGKVLARALTVGAN